MPRSSSSLPHDVHRTPSALRYDHPPLRDLIEDRGRHAGSATYLEDARSDRRVTYADLGNLAGAWTSLLRTAGHGRRVTVIVDVHDPLAYATTLLGVIASGHRAVPIDPSMDDAALSRIVDVLDGTVPLVLSDHPRTGVPGILPFDCKPGSLTPPTAPVRPLPDSALEDPQDGQGSVLLFTSGSTGTPKGVELPERQLLFVASEIADHNHLTPADRGFCPLPLFHINAEVVGLLSTLRASATIALDAHFHRTGFWELLADRRITWLNAVPAILAVLAKSGSIRPPRSLRFIRSASAPLPDVVRKEFAGIPFIISWGMTEGASQITATDPVTDCPPRCVGRPIGCEISVRDVSTGRPVPSGGTGVFWLRGPGIVTRYFHGAAADRFDAQGWLNTGDAGRVDENGLVYLLARTDDVINRGGEKVYPEEIEEWLLADPRIREAVVVGRPDDILTQIPVAYLIPASQDRSPEDDAALLHDTTERCAELPRSRRPAEIRIVSDLPRTATGKIRRAQVRSMLAR